MSTGVLRPAVFLDRDGTINEQMGYINDPGRFHLLPGVGAAIRRCNQAGIPVIVVSNQSGVGRGYFPMELVEEVNDLMVRQLAGAGAHLDGIYVCPHHPEAKVEAYRRACDCRKPRPGLLTRAAAAHHLDLARSYVVGDRFSDLATAAAVGAKGILVLTGYGRGDLRYIGPTHPCTPHYVAEDLAAAVDWILDDLGRVA